MNNENGAIGDIKFSILPPSQFEYINGDNWKLLDGSEMDNEWALTHLLKGTFQTNDEEGEYLESINIDPSLKRNNHFYLPNARGAFLRGIDERNDRDPEKNRRVGGYQEDSIGKHSHNISYKKAGRHSSSSWDKGEGMFLKGDQNHQTQPSGKAETRPKNLAFYIYVRVK